METGKLILTAALMLSAALNIHAQTAQLPAFPSAEGFGMYTTGGRGGQVLHVTSLDDCSDNKLTVGTFRWACKQSGKRIIVFDVSGTIHLTSQLKLNKDNVTILGQTAPGDGVCIADYPFQISCNNAIIRYMRFRLGNKYVAYHEGDGLGSMDKDNIIVDHCSVSWSIDECISVYGGKNITVQWTIGAQSLVNAGHSKGAHGYGGNWGGSGCTYHHNLLAHHTSRVPRLGPRPGTQTDERLDLRNNVFYNWAGNGCYGGEGMNVNIVNNYYKVGPATLKRSKAIQQRIASIGIRTSDYTKHNSSSPNDWDKMWHVWGKFYVRGNVNSTHSDVTKDNWTYGMYNQIDNSKVDYTYTQATKDTMRLRKPMTFMPVTTETAYDAYTKVLSYAGACLHRDALDTLIVHDTRLGVATYTGQSLAPGFINTQDDLRPSGASTNWSPWPTLAQTTPQADSDGDGMPDTWETANGTDPHAADANTLADNGYANIENYANSLVSTITEAQQAGGTLLKDNEEAETGINGEVTGIMGISARNTQVGSSNDIYTLDGRKTGSLSADASLPPLPAGIYICQGRKIIISK